MRKTIYFHVGTVKTGSTLIQKVLWENKNLLEKFNFHYYNQIEPKLSYPRYANAEMLLDPEVKLSDKEINKYIQNVEADNIIISEEGLWANIDMIFNKAFDGFEKKIILYVRKPVDLIAAWASENAEPYNAIQKLHASGIGAVPVSEGIEYFTNRYVAIFKSFFQALSDQEISIIVRPYDRKQFENQDIFRDFLSILGIKSNIFLEDKEFKVTNIANASRTRKFCDISTTTWEIMQEHKMTNKYSLELVEFIYNKCKSGDDRPVVETIDDKTILKIDENLKFIEETISRDYLNGKKLFDNSLPECLGNKNRLPYQPVLRDEIEKLISEYISIENENKEATERIDALRDLALKFEKVNDYDRAYRLMQMALDMRPNGPFIQEKYLAYKKVLNKN